MVSIVFSIAFCFDGSHIFLWIFFPWEFFPGAFSRLHFFRHFGGFSGQEDVDPRSFAKVSTRRIARTMCLEFHEFHGPWMSVRDVRVERGSF